MIRRSCLLILLMAAFSAASDLHAADRDTLRASSKLYPVDEAYKNPSFAEFREQLRSAVARKDTSFLLDCISDSISLGPDKEKVRESSIKAAMSSGHIDSLKARESFAYLDYCDFRRGGKQLFIREWIEYRPPTPEPTIFSTPIWDYLAAILSLGGTFADSDLTVFRAPYVWTRWPRGKDYDFAVIDSNVVREPMKAYGEPDTASCDTLSYDLVHSVFHDGIVGGTPDPTVLIRTADGKCGYVPGNKLRTPTAFGMEFTFSEGKWWITRFAIYP
jgi:hypothetical protein